MAGARESLSTMTGTGTLRTFEVLFILLAAAYHTGTEEFTKKRQ